MHHDEERVEARDQALVEVSAAWPGEGARLAVLVLDRDLRVRALNGRARALFEASQSSNGQHLAEVVARHLDPDSASVCRDRVRRALEGGANTVTLRHGSAGGLDAEASYFDWHIDRTTLPDGRAGVVCHLYDVSAHVRSSLESAAAERCYRHAFESMDAGFCIIEIISEEGRPTDFRFLAVNRVFEEQSGLQDVVGKRMRELVPELEPYWFEFYDRVATGGTPSRRLDRAQPLGDRWFDVYAFRISRPQERRVAVLFRDVTAERRSQAAVQFQAKLLDTVGQAVIVTDVGGSIIYWNRAASDMYGWTAEEVIGRSVLDVTVSESMREQAVDIMATLNAGASWSGEFMVRGKHGPKHALVTNVPIFDEDGSLRAIIGVSADISELKAAQQALRDADRQKDEFLAILGHELRNPLAAIRMALQLLRRGADDGRHARAIDVVDRQSAQLVRLIDDLLDISRITRGKIVLDRKRVDLREIIQQAVDGVEAFRQSQQATIDVLAPPRSMDVNVDPVRIAQVVGNLLHNACKFTPAGRVRVVASQVDQQAVIRVEDEGAGIAADDIERIFEIFTQVTPVDVRQSAGLGIGLALSRRLVEMHGGTLEASSEGLGRGSCFTVRLPLPR